MQLDFPVLKGPLRPSNSTVCLRTAPKRPPKAPNLCTLAADSPKPKTDHILGYVAQNAISSAPNPRATTHFWWFASRKIALTDAYTPVPRPSGLRQAARGSPKRWVPKWVNKVHQVQKTDLPWAVHSSVSLTNLNVNTLLVLEAGVLRSSLVIRSPTWKTHVFNTSCEHCLQFLMVIPSSILAIMG